MYKCGNCGKTIELGREDPVRCPFCGYKILLKTRPQVVKKIKAR